MARKGACENGKWVAEVIADNSGHWVRNGLRFDTRENAEEYVADLAMRWTLVIDTRVVEFAEPESN